ncbi:MAG: NADH-quinone oxidoreductase subunit M [Candidatus Eremiobacteraeota bacterium]|nr:NADH-quinone oxidoreductase subunit M [Candidatus Eremiobacteraeota bacterium]
MIAALVIVPILAGFAVLLLPRRAEQTARWIGVAVAVLAFVAAAASYNAADESARWLSRPFSAAFHVGLGHGVSYWIVLLLTLVTACALLAGSPPWAARGGGPAERTFVAHMLLLLGSMVGVFVARDLLLFALFWDLMLIPVFLAMVASRGRAAVTAWRYLIYNVAGGLVLLLATAAFGIVTGSTDVVGAGSAHAAVGGVAFAWIFGGFAFAFLIKTPVWPLHTWMPDTYADLPSPFAAVVSAVQSKAGLYGFIVIGLGLMPAQMRAAASLMIALGVISLFYGALVALTEADMKRVVAYSSLSHLGLILVALFVFAPTGTPDIVALQGAVVYIVAHGLFSAALFLVLGQIEQREETRLLARLGGLGVRNPKLAGGLTIAALATLGLPGLAGFAGELLIITGIYRAGASWLAAVILVPIIIAAAYMLRLLQDVMNGPQRDDLPQRPDLSFVEGLALAPLVIALVVLGVDPGPVANASAAALQSPSGVALSGEHVPR